MTALNDFLLPHFDYNLNLGGKEGQFIDLTIYIIRVTLNIDSDTVDIRRRSAYVAYP